MRTSKFSAGAMPRLRGMLNRTTSTLSTKGAIEPPISPRRASVKSTRSLTRDHSNVQERFFQRLTPQVATGGNRGIYSRRFAQAAKTFNYRSTKIIREDLWQQAKNHRALRYRS